MYIQVSVDNGVYNMATNVWLKHVFTFLFILSLVLIY